MAEPITTTKVALSVGTKAFKHRDKIMFAGISTFMLLIFGFVGTMGGNPGNTGTGKISEDVLKWQPVVMEYAEKYDVSDYVNVILAIIMVESGGNALDVMQSSESLGLPPNTLVDPIASIDAGVKHFSAAIKNARENELDFWTPVQSYNYGIGFNNFVRDNGKQYSFEVASAFAEKQANGAKVKYSNPVADFNGNFRYAYGNMYYVMLVQQYISAGTGVGNADASALGTDIYTAMMDEAMKYEGWPYVWGGYGPDVGFDCSGLTQHVFGTIGYGLPRTAAEQFNTSMPVSDPQPGDLVFFRGTNEARPADAVTHVGIYIDENRMYDASNSGVGFSNWNQGYWKKHFTGFGRVVK